MLIVIDQIKGGYYYEKKSLSKLAAGALSLVLAAQTVGANTTLASPNAATDGAITESSEAPETTVSEETLPQESPDISVPETDPTETLPTENPDISVPETDPTETLPTENPDISVPETDPTETLPPESSAPETTAPETTVPETTAPETTVPETTAPETTVPETTAPETTVPETTVPETEPLDSIVADDMEPELIGGSALIPAGSEIGEVKEVLAYTLIANYDPEFMDAASFEWEYYCAGKSALGTKNSAWGDIDGFTSKNLAVKYTHPALADNVDGEYRIRLKDSDLEVTLDKRSVDETNLVLLDQVSLTLARGEDGSPDYDALWNDIFDQVIDHEQTVPNLTPEDVTIQYLAEKTILGSVKKEWVALEGGKVSLIDYPAISEGSRQIRISFKGNDAYGSASAETTITVEMNARQEAQLTISEGSQIPLIYNGPEVDYEATRAEILANAVVSNVDLNQTNTEILYYATATTGSAGSIGKAWVPLEGRPGSGLELNYPAITEGEHQIQVSFLGNSDYLPVSVKGSITLTDGRVVKIQLNEAPYEAGMAFCDDLSYDYETTAQAIYRAIVASTTPELPADQILVEYNTDKTGITNSYKPLNETDLTGLVKFGPGKWKVRISWPDADNWKAGSIVQEITMTDARESASVVLKSGVSFTYNMDASVLEQEVFDHVIDWDNSSLPAKESLTPDDFEMAYKGTYTLLSNVKGLDLGWVPFEGKDELVGYYPNMGAGEQKIRVAYKGGSQYRPSDTAETSVTIKKAKAKVTVYSNNIFADEELPHGFVSIVPGDKFDVYTIYAGATSNVTTALYLDLPERITDNKVITDILDPVVQSIFGKSLSQMMNDGVTVGELRQLFNTQELLDLLDKLNIDTGTFGQIMNVINNFPSVLDSIRISFGTPNRAGLYTVVAVSDSPNYETGVGMGMLLVKMRSKGVKLNWNEELPGYTISAQQAKDFDFGVTLSNDGDVTIDQSNVHYLYSGFTSKWRVYSSTTTPPTEPGSYSMTVVTLGGNYQAAPVSRAFRIK